MSNEGHSVEEAVIISIDITNFVGSEGRPLDDLHLLEDRISEVLLSRSVGELDGDEIGEGVFKVFIYGLSANEILDFVKPVLTTWHGLGSGSILRRFGPPGSIEVLTKF